MSPNLYNLSADELCTMASRFANNEKIKIYADIEYEIIRQTLQNWEPKITFCGDIYRPIYSIESPRIDMKEVEKVAFQHFCQQMKHETTNVIAFHGRIHCSNLSGKIQAFPAPIEYKREFWMTPYRIQKRLECTKAIIPKMVNFAFEIEAKNINERIMGNLRQNGMVHVTPYAYKWTIDESTFGDKYKEEYSKFLILLQEKIRAAFEFSFCKCSFVYHDRIRFDITFQSL